MTDDKRFQKDWPKIKKQLLDFSQQAVQMAKKGEKEFIRLSNRGKLHINSTALTLKKEHLYHLIGQEYIRAKCPATPTAKLKQLVEEIGKIDKDQKTLDRQIKSGQVQRAA
jgi:hypothetical protein